MPLKTLNDEPLPDQMQAVVLEKPHTLNYTRIPVWPIEKYEDSDLILVKVKTCGVCGSDLRYYQGENPWSQHTLGVHLKNPPNIVLGHEYSGVVVAVLSESNEEWLGKRVVPICSKVCGICEMCKSNRPNLCKKTIHMGHGAGWGEQVYYPGAYAEYVPAWSAGCYEIPSKCSFEEAAMMDVLAVATHAFHQANHQKEMPLLIMGCGPIGNAIGQVAKNVGVGDENILIFENSEIAIKVAQETGFQNIINTVDLEPRKIIRAAFKPMKKKYFSIFDSIGTETSLNLGLNLLAEGGTYVNLAVHDQNVRFNQMQLSSERKITAASNFLPSDYEEALNWLGEGKFHLKPWMTTITLEECPRIFENTIKHKKQRAIFKIIIQLV
ncbi:MAG TPA: alcohol dehydrogenase catalytic domain-containing protein [Candidatus Deferrimicrobium sp.]|nr:alcohol dehydrogenase catalytic domain-containing protein [Candidatus Deferrimicrobium sp.]